MVEAFTFVAGGGGSYGGGGGGGYGAARGGGGGGYGAPAAAGGYAAARAPANVPAGFGSSAKAYDVDRYSSRHRSRSR